MHASENMLVTPLQRDTINLRSHRRHLDSCCRIKYAGFVLTAACATTAMTAAPIRTMAFFSDAPLPSNMPTNVTSTLLKVTVHSEADF